MKVVSKAKQKWADIFIGEVTTQNVATGAALGTFVALIPSFGFSAFLGLGLVFIFPKINKPAVFLAIAILNPVVQIPIYAVSYMIGTELFGSMPVVKYNFEMLNQVYTFTRRFLVGHMILTSILTVIVYVITFVTMQRILKNSDNKN